MFVEWTEGTAGDIPIDGYLLYMIKKGTGVQTLVYDGSLNPDTKTFEITGLETAEYYALSLKSVNFNGVSEPGPELVPVVCLAPTHIESVKYQSSTLSSITVYWKTPTDMGGCPLLSYALYVNDGLGGSSFTEVDSVQIRDRPYLTQH